MKPRNLIICCDGTWQTREQPYPTNVARLYNAFTAAQDTSNLVYYDQGVGTGNIFSKIMGGAFGFGLDLNIKQAYSFLSSNYQPGDHIYCFGFSRGAYTVRSLCGLIYKCGLVRPECNKKISSAIDLYRNRKIKPDDSESVKFRAENSFLIPQTDNRPWIDFLGCWDTVGSLGIPDLSQRFTLDRFFNKRYEFYDTKISFIIKQARHAVAIDEKRKVFNVTPMTLSNKAAATTNLKEIWFVGTHSSIGGGEKADQQLSEVALNWMAEEIRGIDTCEPPQIAMSLIPSREQLNPCAFFDPNFSTIYKNLGLIDREGPYSFNDLHWSVKFRLVNDKEYTPVILNKFSEEIAILKASEQPINAMS